MAVPRFRMFQRQNGLRKSSDGLELLLNQPYRCYYGMLVFDGWGGGYLERIENSWQEFLNVINEGGKI